MTVLELDRPLAQTPPPVPRQALHASPPRGEAALAVVGGSLTPDVGRETAAEAASRLVASHVPKGVAIGDEVPIELRYRGLGGHQRLAGLGRLYAGRPGDVTFAAALVVADPLVLLTVSQEGRAASHWALVPGGPVVTARADALRLIRAMRADGELVLRAGDKLELPPLELSGADTWSRADEHEWQLFEDLATLEEWSGITIPIPPELSGEEVARIAQAAMWVRTERLEASLSGVLEFTVANGRDLRAVDELRLRQDFGVTFAGREVPIGTGVVHIPVEVASLDGPDADGLTMVRARPRPRQIVFVLEAPARRRLPARRTQPPAPRPGRPPSTEHTLALPIVMPASRPFSAVLRAVADRPVVSAASSTALLDDLRGEGA